MNNLRKKLKKNYDIYRKHVVGSKKVFKVPLGIRLKMYLKGFTSDQYIRYNFKENDMKEYISDFERWKTRDINGRFNFILDDKLIFHKLVSPYANVPDNFGWIQNGHIYTPSGDTLTKDSLVSLINENQKMVLKPVIDGGAGKSVKLIEYKNELYFINSKSVDLKGLIDEIYKSNDFLLSKFVEQNDYSNNIFPYSVNTIRVVSVHEGDGVDIIEAAHRFGTNDTAPVDNASVGALVASVNMVNGVLGEAKEYLTTQTYTYHPDTNEKIKDVKIPNWDLVKEDIIRVHSMLPYLKFVAWDIVITKDSYSIIEGNASTGTTLFQLWEGKRNSKLGSFYKRVGAIK